MSVSIRVTCGPRFLAAGFVAASMAMAAGCGSEGAGSIKISDPAAIRAKAGVAGNETAKETPKQAKAKALMEEAAKKHPKMN